MWSLSERELPHGEVGDILATAARSCKQRGSTQPRWGGGRVPAWLRRTRIRKCCCVARLAIGAEVRLPGFAEYCTRQSRAEASGYSSLHSGRLMCAKFVLRRD